MRTFLLMLVALVGYSLHVPITIAQRIVRPPAVTTPVVPAPITPLPTPRLDDNLTPAPPVLVLPEPPVAAEPPPDVGMCCPCPNRDTCSDTCCVRQ
jgi:hypothetical protein